MKSISGTEGSILTVAEIVQYKQPEIWLILVRRYLVFIVDWARLMEERPKSGIGGLLPGEKVVNL